MPANNPNAPAPGGKSAKGRAAGDNASAGSDPRTDCGAGGSAFPERTEAAPRPSEQLFRAAVEQAADAFFLCTLDGKILDVNRRACDSLGYTRAELLSMTLADVDPEVESRRHRERFWESLVPREPITIEGVHRRKDGTTFPVEVRACLVQLGEELRMLGLVRDVTERKRAEGAINASERNYRELFDAADDMIFVHDAETGAFRDVNRAALDAFGYTREEMMAMAVEDISVGGPPFTQSEAERLIRKSAREGTIAFEWHCRRKSGELFWCENRLKRAVIGGEDCVLCVARDVTERRRAEEARRGRVHFLESLDRVNRAIQQADDVERMLWDAAEVVRSIYDCDRVWLLYPCDPDAPSFRVPVERTRPEYPGACVINQEVPMTRGLARDLADALASDEPVCSTFGTERPVCEQIAAQFDVASQICMAVYPKTGEPWVFGMHQCSHARAWTEEERRLFQQIGRRLGDALGELLIFRDLRESEKRYRDLVDRMTDVIFTLDRRGVVTSVNPVIESLLGFTPDEITGTHFGAFLLEDSLPQTQRTFERVLSEGEATDSAVMIHKDGGLRYVEYSSSAIERHRDVVGVRGILRDVTDRKQAEDLVRVQRDLGAALGATNSLDEGLRLGLEAAIRVAQMDCGGVYLVDEFSGSLELACHRGLRPAFVAAVSHYEPDSPHVRLLKETQPIYTEHGRLDLPRNDAEPRGGLRAFATLPLRHEDRVIGHMNVASHVREDVPESCRPALEAIANQMGGAIARLRAEQSLRDSEQRYRDLVENSTYGVAIHQDGRIRYANRAALGMLGYGSMEEIVDKSVLDFVHPDDQAEIASRIRGVLETGTPAPPVERRLLAADGRVVDVEVSGTRLTYRGRPAIQSIFADVTERKQAQERLHEMETQLAHVSRVSAMGEMVAGIAHEISQPLYAVVNFAKASGNCLAAEGELDVETLREWNAAMAETAARAGGIIQRLRDFVRRAPPHRARVDVNEVVRESVDLLAFEAHRRGVTLSPELSEPAPAAFVDRVQIQQVLVNLIQNALEALDGPGGNGRPRVAIRTGASGPFATISVADNGPGLPQDATKIFDAFVTTKAGGLGMGLAISRTIVEAHDGEISAASNPGGGAVFQLKLPTPRRHNDC